MANKTVNTLKTSNRDFHSLIDSFVPALYQNYTVSTASTITAVANYEYTIGLAAGIDVTLPTMNAGDRIKFNVSVTVTSNAYDFVTASATALLSGYAFIEDNDNAADNNYAYFAPDGSDDNDIALNGTTTGGLIGDQLDFTGISATNVLVRAWLKGTGSIATCFS